MSDKSALDVYENLSAEGEYKISVIDLDVIKKMISTAVGDSHYIDFLLKQTYINWRIIYTLYYDVLRELCEALIRLDGIKVRQPSGMFCLCLYQIL